MVLILPLRFELVVSRLEEAVALSWKFAGLSRPCLTASSESLHVVPTARTVDIADQDFAGSVSMEGKRAYKSLYLLPSSH